MLYYDQKYIDHVRYCGHGTNPANTITCELEGLLVFAKVADSDEWLIMQSESIQFIKYLISACLRREDRMRVNLHHKPSNEIIPIDYWVE